MEYFVHVSCTLVGVIFNILCGHIYSIVDVRRYLYHALLYFGFVIAAGISVSYRRETLLHSSMHPYIATIIINDVRFYVEFLWLTALDGHELFVSH